MSDSSNPSTTHPNAAQPRFSLRTTIFLVLSMLAILAAMGSQGNENVNPVLQTSATPEITQSITPIPATPTEVIEPNSEYTMGLIFGAILLLLIIIIGTLAVIRQKD